MKCIITFLFALSLLNVCAQDTSKIIHPYPKRAAIMSAIIPGSGQIYNHIYASKKSYGVYWKIPIIYSSLYFATTTLIKKINLEKELRTEYNNRIQNNIISPKWQTYDNYNLVLLEKSAAKSRNTLYFLVGGIYLIQIIEASIDAHFSHFDLSPNLSMNIHPYYNVNSPVTGLTFAFNLK